MNIEESFDQELIDSILENTDPELIQQLNITLAGMIERLSFSEDISTGEKEGLLAVFCETFLAGYTYGTADTEGVHDDSMTITLTHEAATALINKAITEVL